MEIYVFVGILQLYPYTFTPLGYMSCEGQTLSISQYQTLYALIGSTYGGDGQTTFALPNLKGAEPLPQLKYYIALDGLYPQQI
jgi:microcystin-dependent protein